MDSRNYNQKINEYFKNLHMPNISSRLFSVIEKTDFEHAGSLDTLIV